MKPQYCDLLNRVTLILIKTFSKDVVLPTIIGLICIFADVWCIYIRWVRFEVHRGWVQQESVYGFYGRWLSSDDLSCDYHSSSLSFLSLEFVYDNFMKIKGLTYFSVPISLYNNPDEFPTTYPVYLHFELEVIEGNRYVSNTHWCPSRYMFGYVIGVFCR